MLSNFTWIKAITQNPVKISRGSIFLFFILFITACVEDSDQHPQKKTVEQYVSELKIDVSYVALQEAIQKLTNEARLSKVEIYQFLDEDQKKLSLTSGEVKEKMIHTFTNNPRFVTNAESLVTPLLVAFVNNHKDLAKEEPQLVYEVFEKLHKQENERYFKKSQVAKEPDCAGQCNQAYGSSMLYCGASYTVAIASLIVATASSGPGAVPTAAAGYIIATVGRDLCEGSALDGLSACHTACGMNT